MPAPRASAVVAALMLAVGFVPLFGGPGYEQALATGLVVPSASAIVVALDVGSSKSRGPSPLAWLVRGLGLGAWFAGIAFATALLHGLRVGFCDLPGGARDFVLTGGFGALLGGAWGALVGALVRTTLRRRVRLACVLGALAGPLLGIAVSLARFYGSPAIFALLMLPS